MNNTQKRIKRLFQDIKGLKFVRKIGDSDQFKNYDIMIKNDIKILRNISRLSNRRLTSIIDIINNA